MRNFRTLDVWKDSMSLVRDIYSIANTLPDSEKFDIISQIKRCSVSIPSNIAEGCVKDSQKDFFRFLQISLGSAFELETQLEICSQLFFIDKKEIDELINDIVIIQRE